MNKNLRFFVIIAAFACVIASSVFSILFAYKIGVPDFSYIMLIVCLLVNVAQFTMYLISAIKSIKGVYFQNIKYAILGTNVLWVVLVLVHFIVASTQGFLRYDLLVVSICQLVTLLLIYLWWNKIEYMTARKAYANPTSDINKMQCKSFVLFLLVVLAIQLVSVALPYVITSKVYENDDLKYRTLAYEKSANGNEYYVSGVFWGQSNLVFIPSEFNGLPVTRINENAINANTLKNKLFNRVNSINEIVFEDTDIRPSNVKVICSNAIVSENITSLFIPKSLEQIQTRAIVADNLTEIVCAAKSGEVYIGGSIVAPRLTNLSINATSDMSIGFTEDFESTDLKVKIINDNFDPTNTDKLQEKYNHIRKNYPMLKSGLDVSNIGGKIVVDFETGLSDIYIDSKIMPLSGGIVTMSTALFGGLQNATEAYVLDNDYLSQDDRLIFHPIDSDPTAHGYVFRGWQNLEGNATSFSPVSFTTTLSKDTTLTAKWQAVHKVEYNWGRHYVPENNQSLDRYFIAGEQINNFSLPVFSDYNRAGYTDLKWYCLERDDSLYSLTDNYTSTRAFDHSVKITPIWNMEVPLLTRVVSFEHKEGSDVLSTASLVFTYDEQSTLYADYTLSHALRQDDIKYLINWTFTPSDEVLRFGATAQQGSFHISYDSSNARHSLIENVVNKFADFKGEYDEINHTYKIRLSVRNVLESGTYSLSAKAYSSNTDREESVDSTPLSEISVSIERKELDLEYYGARFESNHTFVYDGTGKSITARLDKGDAPLRFEYSGNGKAEVSEIPYEVVATAVKTKLSADGDQTIDDFNYANKPLNAYYTISKCPVRLRWYLDGKGFYGIEFDQIYDGNLHFVRAEYAENTPAAISSAGAIVLDSAAHYTSEARNAATYTAKVAELSAEKAKNYYFEFDEDSSSSPTCVWTIHPRPVDLRWGSDKNFVYNKKPQIISASIANLVSGDNCVLTYEGNVETNVPQDSYTARVTDVSNSNYTLVDSVNKTKEWSIAPKPLLVEWATSNSEFEKSAVDNVFRVIYNSTSQSVYARPLNHEQGDVITFSYNGSRTSALGSVTNDNNASQVGAYAVSIDEVQGEPAGNYTLSNLDFAPNKLERSCDWVIEKKVLTKSWSETLTYTYDGTQKQVGLTLFGFAENDVAQFGVEDFTCTGGTAVDGSFNLLSAGQYNLVFSAFDANLYEIDCTAIASSNYLVVPAETKTPFKINTKTLSIEWYLDAALSQPYTEDSLVYNATVQAVYPKIIGIVNNERTQSMDVVIPTISGNRKAMANSAHIAQITSISNTNYRLDSTKSLSWKIAPAPITLEYSAPLHSEQLNYVYDGQIHGAWVKLSGFQGTDNASVNLDSQFTYVDDTKEPLATRDKARRTQSFSDDELTIAFDGVFAAQYYFSLKDNNDTNYQISDMLIEFVIAPRPVTVSWNKISGYEYEYDHSTKIVSAEVTNQVQNVWSNPITPDIVALNLTGQRSSLAGSYTARITGTNNHNYTVSKLANEEEYKKLSWSIRKRTLTSQWQGENLLTYDAQNHEILLRVSNLTAEDKSELNQDDFTISLNGEVITGGFSVLDDDPNFKQFSFVHKDASSYRYVVALNYPNYEPFSVEQTLTISQKPLEVNWQTVSLVYNGQNQSIEATPILFEGDTTTISYSHASNAKNVGTYSTAITSQSNLNYSIVGLANRTCDWTITPKLLSASFAANDFTYTGAEQVMQLTIDGFITSELEDIVFAEEFVYSFNAEGADRRVFGEVVGEKYIVNFVKINHFTDGVARIVSFSDPNYSLASVQTDFDVKKRTVIPEWHSTDLTYNAEQQSTYVEFTNCVEGDIIEVTYKQIEGYTNIATDAGIYTAYISSIDNPNYDVEAVSAEARSCNWRINPKLLDVGIIDDRHFTYKKGDIFTELKIIGFCKPDQASVGSFTVGGDCALESITSSLNEDTNEYTYDLHFKGVDAKTYQVTLSSFTNTNYTITKAMRYSFTIDPKPLTYQWNYMDGSVANHEYTYIGSQMTLTPIVSQGKFVGDEVVLTYSDNFATDVGTLTAEVTGCGNTNYCSDSSKRFTWTINPILLQIDWSATDTFTYNKTECGVTATISNVLPIQLDSMKQNFVTANNIFYSSISDGKLIYDVKAINANEYVARISNTNANYKLPSNYAKPFTIDKKLIYVVWGANDGYVYKGAPFYAMYSISGVLGDDEIELDVYDNDKTDAGSYTARITQALRNVKSNSNYKLDKSNLTRDWSIAPKPLVALNWSDGSEAVYNAQYYTVSLNIENVYSRDLNNISVQGIFDRDAMSRRSSGNSLFIDFKYKKAQRYDMTVTGFNSNYTISSTGKTFLINPKPITIGWTNTSFVYNAQQLSVSAVAEGNVGNENVGFEYTAESVTRATKVGTYNVIVYGITNTDYTIADLSSAERTTEWSIAKKTLTAEWSNVTQQTFTYTKQTQGKNLVISGFAENPQESAFAFGGAFTALRPSVSINQNAKTATLSYGAVNVGTYTLKNVSLRGEFLVNYSLNVPASLGFVINHKHISGSWQKNASYTYDGTEKDIVYTLVGIYEGDTVNIPSNKIVGGGSQQGNTLNYSIKNANSYNLGVLEYTSDNYIINANSTAVTVTRKALVKTANNVSVEYNAQNQKFEIAIDGFVAEDLVALTLAVFNVGISSDNDSSGTSMLRKDGQTAILEYYCKNADSYQLSYRLDGLSDYEVASGVYSFIINPKPIANVSWHNHSDIVYDGTNHRPYATSSDIIDANVSFVYDLSAQTNASDYSIAINGIVGSGNYELTNSAKESLSWSIAPKPITLSWPQDGALNLTYTGEEQSISATITNSVGNDMVNISYVGNTGTAVGSYLALAVAVSNSNYTIAGADDLSRAWKIDRQALSVSWNSVLPMTYNTFSQGISCTISGFKNEQDLTKIMNELETDSTCTVSKVPKPDTLCLDVNFTAINAGDYVAEIIGKAFDDYTIAETTKGFEIKRKEIALGGWCYSTDRSNWLAYSVNAKPVYTGEYYYFKAITSTVMDSLVFNYSQRGVSLSVGTYPKLKYGSETVCVIGLENTNYSIAQNAIKEMIVDVAPLELQAQFIKQGSRQVMENGSQIEYCGEFTLEYAIANSETLTMEGKSELSNSLKINNSGTFVFDVKDVGTYDYAVTLIEESPFVFENNEKSFNFGFSIIAKALEMSEYDSTVTYSSAQAHAQALAQAVSGIVEGDSFSEIVNVLYYFDSECTIRVYGNNLNEGNYWFKLQVWNLGGGSNYTMDNVTVYELEII